MEPAVTTPVGWWRPREEPINDGVFPCMWQTYHYHADGTGDIDIHEAVSRPGGFVPLPVDRRIAYFDELDRVGKEAGEAARDSGVSRKECKLVGKQARARWVAAGEFALAGAEQSPDALLAGAPQSRRTFTWEFRDEKGVGGGADICHEVVIDEWEAYFAPGRTCTYHRSFPFEKMDMIKAKLLTIHMSTSNQHDIVDISCTSMGGAELVSVRSGAKTTIADLRKTIADVVAGPFSMVLPSGQCLDDPGRTLEAVLFGNRFFQVDSSSAVARSPARVDRIADTAEGAGKLVPGPTPHGTDTFYLGKIEQILASITDPQMQGQESAVRICSRVLLLRNLIGTGAIDGELQEDVVGEAGRFGEVLKCSVQEMSGEPDDKAVRVFLEFARANEASKAFSSFNGRHFSGRIVHACFYDEVKFAAGDLTCFC